VRRYGAESRTDRKRIAWPPVSGTSALGFALTPLVLGHVYVNRVLPLLHDGSSANVGLEYVAHGFARHRAVSFVGFSALVGVATWHFVWGAAKWMRWTPASVVKHGPEGQVIRKRRWYVLNAVSAAVTALWLAGGLGVVGRGGQAEGWLAGVYDELYQRIPFFGQWY
jgi:hypothetical protein